MIRTLVIILFLLNVQNTFAQCITAGFNAPVSACLDERLELSNISTNYDSLYWDFCADDFNAVPSSNTIGTIPGLNQATGLKVIYDNSEYIGFVVSRSLNKLYRLEFNESLGNSPNVIDMGNPGDLLSSPEGIDIMKYGSNWIGIIGYEPNGGNLIALNFGSDLKSVPITTNIGSPVVGRVRNPQLVIENNDIILVFAYYNGNSIYRVNYHSSLTDPIVPGDIYDSGAITDISLPIGLGLYSDCGNWKGVITSYSTIQKIVELDFGASILNVPSTIGSFDITSLSKPFRVNIVDQGDSLFAIIANETGLLTLLNIGPMDGSSPIELDNSSLPQLKDVHTYKSNSGNYMIGIGSSTSITEVVWRSTCSENIGYSYLEEPYGLSYSTDGKVKISLTAINSSTGESATTANTINVNSSEAPQLNIQITGNCLSNPISFTGQQLSGNINSWSWDFGDGSGISSLQNDTYTYASVGTYQVKLNVTDANGCNNLHIDTVIVYEEPIPDYTFPVGTLCMNNPVTFTNTTTGETGPAVTWTWDFNGEGSSSEKEPSFTFLSSGNKTVTLTSSIPGCANVTQQTMFIEEAPTTSFSFNNVCNSQTTTFNDLTVGADLTAWNWDFGDGIFSTDQHPTHTYVVAGKYAVTLTVNNNLGCSTSKTDTVYSHAVPVVSFVYDLPCSSTPIQFIDQSIVQDAGLVVWEWNFGDGNTSTERNPQYTYGQTGAFTVQLKAYSQFGCVDSTESSITVIQGPEVDFNWDISCVDELTSFTDITNSFGQPITSWTWLIDDQIINEQNPQYTFGTSGTYAVQLSVTTNNLCAQTISKDINVEATPLTSFDYSETCEDNTVTFFDTTPTSTTQWEWKVDGTVSSIDSVMPKNLLPGSHMISLATTTTSGCTGALSQNINIVGSPTAQFTSSTNYGAAPLSIQFTNESTGADNYFWDFGDASNSSSTEINPEFIFNNIGMYNVTLIAYGGQNCADTTVQSIEVVDAIHGLSLDAITLLDGGSLALTLTNMGSYTYNGDNLQLVFTLDNGAEIPEPLATALYPQKTINYVANITLGDINNSQVLCAELQFIDANPLVVLDKNCLNLNSQATIADAYPNPANDFINLSIILPESGKVRITLIDRTGAVIMNDTYEAALLGLNNYTIDTTPYRSGLYIIKIETDNVVKKMKVVIDR